MFPSYWDVNPHFSVVMGLAQARYLGNAPDPLSVTDNFGNIYITYKYDTLSQIYPH